MYPKVLNIGILNPAMTNCHLSLIYVIDHITLHDRHYLDAWRSELGPVHVVTFDSGGTPQWLHEIENVHVHNLIHPRIAYDDPDESRYPGLWPRFRLYANFKYYEAKLKKLIRKIRPGAIQGAWAPTDGYLAARSGFRPFIFSPFVTDIVKLPKRSVRLRKKINWIFGQADHITIDAQWLKDDILNMVPDTREDRISIVPRPVRPRSILS